MIKRNAFGQTIRPASPAQIRRAAAWAPFVGCPDCRKPFPECCPWHASGGAREYACSQMVARPRPCRVLP